ncbi:MAG: branched-chain amino acid aminotransferase [Clostridiales bacterium]|nr:branched-chain amino acid aminotransferase [Clostridiales bacterium]
MQDIRFVPATSFKQKPGDPAKMGFGKLFTDYMFVMDYEAQKGWHDARIEPYQNFQMDPATAVLHYGQAIFEGLKAYRREDGGIQLFRPQANFQRMNRSAERMAIPKFDEELALKDLLKLVEIEKDWVPTGKGTSLYIRPTIIATDPFLGVHASHTYRFYIIVSPSGAYYTSGLAPVNIYVEDKYVRAVRGGVGFAKAAGNYAASLRAAELAAEKGYTQVLWLDGVEQKYVEEVGAMNMMFVIDGKVVTPMLNGSILPGITRDSILTLSKHLGYEAEERRLPIEEVFEAARAGRLDEAFGTGTAAVVSPVGKLCWREECVGINGGEIGPLTQKLYDTLTGMQYGDIPDEFGWIVRVV